MTAADRHTSSGGPGTPEFPLGFGWALAICAAITMTRLAALFIQPLDLHPDEAQYWSWSRDLAWGYFSKPPMIGWLIAGATALCGAGEGCIKAPVPLLHFVTALLVYGIGRRLCGTAVGFFAALAFITLPGVSFSATIASTDPPLMMFWALSLYAFVRLWQGGSGGWWLVLGVAAGLGLMSKYAMAFFAVGLVLLVAFDPEARRRLAVPGGGVKGLAAAALIAFAIYLPNLLWNMSTGFVTYEHTGANANLGGNLLNPAAFLEFFASQFGVFGPILFAGLIWSAVRVRAWARDPALRLLAAFALPMLLVILALSFLSRANANWAAPSYIAATVWVTAVLLADGRRLLAGASLALHSLVAALVVIGMLVHSAPGVYAGMRVPTWLDIYKNYDGWRELGAGITKLRAQYPSVPIVSEERKLIAAMLYYVHPWPDDVYAWFANPRITDHFKLTRPFTATQGADALIVSSYGDAPYVQARFRSAEPVAAFRMPIGSGEGATVRVFYARDFLGYNASRPTESLE
ncbi:MAG: glycosyltransferase family 39 protein [Acetobacterales bacterium]